MTTTAPPAPAPKSGSLLAKLDVEQLAAVTAPLRRPTLVVAGPGSGKTRVIATRIAWYIEMGVDPTSIVAFTFTNKAAAELRARIHDTLVNNAGDDAERRAAASAAAGLIYAGTFHSFGARFLRENADRIGINPKFTIYDRDDVNAACSRLLRTAREGEGSAVEDGEKVTNAQLGRYINLMKNAGVTPAEALAREPDNPLAVFYERYQNLLDQAYALDFNDLVRLPVMLMQERPELLNAAQQQAQHVLVDEYQDTNRNQASLVMTLAGPGPNASLYAVGDPDQSIYAFQFAAVDNILQFAQRDYPGAAVYRLNRNYRSQASIVEHANRLIHKNRQRIERSSVAVRAPVKAPIIRRRETESEEAQAVINGIKMMKEQGQASYDDWCVAYRVNAQSQPLEEACMQAGVPYRVRGGFEFYKRAEIAIAVAYLRLALNPQDTVALEQVLNVPRRGIGATARQRLESYADLHRISMREALQDMADAAASYEDEVPGRRTTERTRAGANHLLQVLGELELAAATDQQAAAAVMERLLHGACGLEEYCKTQPGDGENRWSNLNRLNQMAAYHQGTLAEFCDSMRLYQRDEEKGDAADEDRLTLSTLHQTKGLEWPNVAIIGLEQGALPHQMCRERRELEEERRLFYVGCTRAQDLLVISYCTQKNGKPQQRSQFLREFTGS